MFRSSIARLAALYTGAFALAVAGLGAASILTMRSALYRGFDDRLRFEAAALVGQYKIGGLVRLRSALRQRDLTPGAPDYGLESPGGVLLAGSLHGARGARSRWSMLSAGEPGDPPERTRVFTTVLPGGYRLLVGDDVDRIAALNDELFWRFATAFSGVILLGAAAGFAFNRNLHRRIAAITATAEAIIDGDLGRRVGSAAGDDDLERLAATFNRMLDRIAALLESLRQMSGDIAHELRTPLSRLRQRLEGAASLAPKESALAIEAALSDVDTILDTFAALLRIAQVESGARRAGFRQTDLAAVARTVVEAFAPSAEDAGGAIILDAPAPLVINGDPELLTQLAANLVENALRHAGPRATVQVRCGSLSGTPVLEVIDDGPGVPASERVRLFERFHRLDESRSTSGSGLGLAMVAAVARLHDAEASLTDAAPGLVCRIAFTNAQTQR